MVQSSVKQISVFNGNIYEAIKCLDIYNIKRKLLEIKKIQFIALDILESRLRHLENELSKKTIRKKIKGTNAFNVSSITGLDVSLEAPEPG